jgi:hypothetical protein
MKSDAEHVTRLARERAAELEAAAAGGRPPRGLARLGRSLTRLRLGLARHARSLVRDHWDLGLFDLAFGSLKAFGLYPALFFAGLAWAIPLLEYAPLNTQLWTAGYLLARRKLLSAAGRVRYGRSGEELDALRARLLRSAPSEGYALHRFGIDGAEYGLRVRRSRLAACWDRVRGRTPAPGTLLQSQLREMLANEELCFRAEPLRTNPYLYERVLIEALLKTDAGRARLAAASIATTGEDDDELRALLPDPEPTRARLDAEGDRLRAVLGARLGSAESLVARGLAWLHAGHRRAIQRRLGELRDLEYRLLAALAGGEDAERSGLAETIRRRRRVLATQLGRATRLVARASLLRSKSAALRLLHVGLREARTCGLGARRAALALSWYADLSPALALASPAAGRIRA